MSVSIRNLDFAPCPPGEDVVVSTHPHEQPDIVPERARARVPERARVAFPVIQDRDSVSVGWRPRLERREAINGARARRAVDGVRGRLDSVPLILRNGIDVERACGGGQFVPAEAYTQIDA